MDGDNPTPNTEPLTPTDSIESFFPNVFQPSNKTPASPTSPVSDVGGGDVSVTDNSNDASVAGEVDKVEKESPKPSSSKESAKPKAKPESTQPSSQSKLSSQSKPKEPTKDLPSKKVEEVAELGSKGEEGEISEEVISKVLNFTDKNDPKSTPVELNIDSEVTLTTKAGKEAKVTLGELTNDYWGKSEVSRRINEVNDFLEKEVNPFKERTDYVSSLFEQVNKNLNEEKPVDAVNTLLSEFSKSFKGGDTALQEFYNHMYGEFNKLSQMSEDERGNYNLQQENARLKGAEQDRMQAETAQQNSQLVEQTVTGMMDKYSTTRENVSNIYNHLINKGIIEDGMDINSALSTLNTYVEYNMYSQTAVQLLSEVDMDLSSNEAAIEDIIHFQRMNPEATKETIENRVKALYGADAAAAKASARARKHAEATGQTPAKKDSPKVTQFTETMKKNEKENLNYVAKFKEAFKLNDFY